MNKKIQIAIGLALIIIIGFVIYSQKQSSIAPTSAPLEATNTDTSGASGTSEATSLPTPSGIALSEVAQHNTRSTCWSAINGGVYDLTSWIPNHPGGEQAIISLCGIDGSSAFNRQHGGSRKVLAVLAGFKIGTLAN